MSIFFLLGGINIKDFLINEQINFSKVSVINKEGENLGSLEISAALELAYSKDLDLVLVSPNANNPVCKIMDYSKFKFDMVKKAKEAKKNQKTVETKEIRLSPVIDKHDLEVKAKNAQKFLNNGDKVKVALRFRGRQMSFIDQGREVMEVFKSMLTNFQVDKDCNMEGRNLVIFISRKEK